MFLNRGGRDDVFQPGLFGGGLLNRGSSGNDVLV